MNRIGCLDPTRAEFDDRVGADELRELVRQPSLRVLQCASPVKSAVWRLLNECFFSARPDVELRVYGHYSTGCDLKFATLMTNVRRFAADCMLVAKNVDAVGEIPNLESLSLGIFELEGFDVLERVPSTLKVLKLGATRSRKPSLAPLSRFRSLRVLYLEGQSRDIEVLSKLHTLEDVTLRSITTPDLTYLACLPNLWSLDIKLGGIRGFEGIEGKESIKYLELWQVRMLRDVSIVGALPGLQNLLLQSLPRITSFPTLTEAHALRRIVIENLKGLSDFRPFELAPALEEFALIDGQHQAPDQLLPILKNRTVQRLRAGFGSDRKNHEFSRLREQFGKAEWRTHEPFEYR